MASLQDKLQQLEQATATAQNDLLQKESKLKSATEALNAAKTKLKALSPEAQETLQVNDTELPELLEAEIAARVECDEARQRYETNVRYVGILKEKIGKS